MAMLNVNVQRVRIGWTQCRKPTWGNYCFLLHHCCRESPDNMVMWNGPFSWSHFIRLEYTLCSACPFGFMYRLYFNLTREWVANGFCIFHNSVTYICFTRVYLYIYIHIHSHICTLNYIKYIIHLCIYCYYWLLFLFFSTNTHAHTHTHVYIYIHMYAQTYTFLFAYLLSKQWPLNNLSFCMPYSDLPILYTWSLPMQCLYFVSTQIICMVWMCFSTFTYPDAANTQMPFGNLACYGKLSVVGTDPTKSCVIFHSHVA